MTVGENIKVKRLSKGLLQAELAKQAGITQAMLCQIEKGTKNPSLQVSYEIAKILGCHIEDFLK